MVSYKALNTILKPKNTASIQLEVRVIGVGNNTDINEMFTM